MKKTYYYCACGLLLLGLGSCQKAANGKAEATQPIRVSILTVSASAPLQSKPYSGTVQENRQTSISFSTSGTVQSVHFELGDRIEKGQLLATLDPASYQNLYEISRATLLQTQDAYERYKVLHEKGSLPEIQWIEAESSLQRAKAQEAIARKNLDDCKLYAPCSGVISAKNVEPGQNIAPGLSIGTLLSTDRLKVKIAVPEAEIAQVTIGQEASIGIPALGGGTLSGKVCEKGIAANPLARSYEVKIALDQPVRGLMPGMVAKATLDFSGKTPVLFPILPASLVQIDEHNQNFVWTVEEGRAHKRPVSCGEFTAQGVAITSGLEAGDQVICSGQQKVSEQTLVTTR